MMRPNILLIMTDQMRGDCMSCAGHPDVKTPYLDTLASEGVRFSHAYSSCPSCIPARAALMTGMSQEKHGRVGYKDGVPWRYPHTLAGELSKAGYHTECVGKMHTHPLRNSLGFHHVKLHDGYLHYYRSGSTPSYEQQQVADDYNYEMKSRLGIHRDLTEQGVECNSWVVNPWQFDISLHPTHWVTDGCIDFLRRRDREQPFFLMASYLRPHPPFDPPEKYLNYYLGRDLTPPAVGDWEEALGFLPNGQRYDSTNAPADPELRRIAMAGYYACISHLDHEIGRLMMAMNDADALTNTVILFLADHGELLFDHNLFRKSMPYEGAAHIPCIIKAPEIKSGVSDEVVELRDIMPTLLELAGAPIPDTVDGQSLLPTMREETPLRPYLHGEHAIGARTNHFIVTKEMKYAWYSQTGKEQLFDLKNDPKELHDLSDDPAYAAECAKLRGYLIEALTGREEGMVEDGKLVVGRTYRPLLRSAGFEV